MDNRLKIGDKAPDFTVYNQNQEEINLKELKGNWVILYFYPKDNTPGCTKEAVGFSEYKEKFEELNAKIYGMSKDSIRKHKNFIEKQNLTINLLSNEDTNVIQNYCAWGVKKMYGKEYEGIIRTTYLINPDQEIEFVWEKVKVKGHVEEVYKKLKEVTGTK
jgi:peroxiredoxin Q/BCP